MSIRTLCSRVIIRRDSLDGENSLSPSFIPVPKAHKGAIDPTSETTKLMVCSYCDVVVSRPPSPVKETMRHDPEGLDLVSTGISLPIVQNDNDDTSNSSDSKGDNQYPWTLAQCRHMHSLDSTNIPSGNKFIRKKITLKGLSNEQKLAIEVAAAALTKSNKKKLLNDTQLQKMLG